MRIGLLIICFLLLKLKPLSHKALVRIKNALLLDIFATVPKIAYGALNFMVKQKIEQLGLVSKEDVASTSSKVSRKFKPKPK